MRAQSSMAMAAEPLLKLAPSRLSLFPARHEPLKPAATPRRHGRPSRELHGHHGHGSRALLELAQGRLTSRLAPACWPAGRASEEAQLPRCLLDTATAAGGVTEFAGESAMDDDGHLLHAWLRRIRACIRAQDRHGGCAAIGQGQGGRAAVGGRRGGAGAPQRKAEELRALPRGGRANPLLQGDPCSKAGEPAFASRLHEALPRRPYGVQAKDEQRLRMEGHGPGD